MNMSRKYPIFLPGVSESSSGNISTSISQHSKTLPFSFNTESRPMDTLTPADMNRSRQSQMFVEKNQSLSNIYHDIPNNTLTRSQCQDSVRASNYNDYKSDPTETSSLGEKHFSQKRIFQYFPDVKNNDNRRSPASKKRSLDDLKQKYDTVFNISPNASRNEIVQKLSYAEQITRKRMLPSSLPVNKGFDMSPRTNPLALRNPENEGTPIQKQKKLKSTEMQNLVEPKMLHLIGHVEHILRWNHILKDTGIYTLYNVIGIFISSMDGTHMKEKFAFIRGNNGTILECSFFEIDRSLPKITKGQYVSCFGQIIGIQRLRMYSIDILIEGKHTETQRAIFLSQRAIHEFRSRKSTS